MVVGNPQPHSLALSRDHSNHHLSFPLLPIFPPPLRLPLPLLIPTISLPLPLLLTRFFNFFLFFFSTSAYSTTNLHVILRCYLLIECLVIPFLLQCQLINTVKIVTSSSFSYKLQTPMFLFTPINHACIIGNTTRKFPVPPIKKTPIFGSYLEGIRNLYMLRECICNFIFIFLAWSSPKTLRLSCCITARSQQVLLCCCQCKIHAGWRGALQGALVWAPS